MKEKKLFFGIVFLFAGIIFCFTIVDAIIGIPLIVVRIILFVSWRRQKIRETVREAARELGRGLH